MKILIADDQLRRYPRLIEALGERGIDREAVRIVPSASDARTALAETSYDLLILDILIPYRPEDEPDAQHALDLLVELHDANEINRPGRILGITADRAVTGEAADAFEARTWSVLNYAADNDDWLTRALACVDYILAERARPAMARVTYDIDVAIICALAAPELEEVLKLPWNWGAPRPIDDHVFVHDGWFMAGERRVSVAAASAPRMGMVATALLTAAVIATLHPRLIAMCGICAGVRGKVEIGDVVMADPAWDFQSGKRIGGAGDQGFAPAPHQLYASPLVRAHLEQIRADAAALAQLGVAFGSDAPRSPRLKLGPLASGSAVLADGKVIQEITQQHRELLGVEMEAYGLYAAAQLASRPRPQVVALKSVCDFADPDKGDDHQRYAAYTSAGVLQLLLERFGERLLNASG